jgi:hypothetical protein
MSNKDYYGQPQQQYYPPAGAAFSHDVIILILMRVCIIRSTRSGWLLSAAASAGISGLRWPAWLSTTASASTGLRVRFDVLSRCWSINHCVLSCSQQPPQRKNDDFCTACLTGVCLCCALESGWLRSLRPHCVLKGFDSTLQLPFLTSASVSTLASSLPSKFVLL